MIDPEPVDWRDLEERVARILRECCIDVTSPHKVALARGEAEVDVFAVDHTAIPPITTVCECKQWQTAVRQNVVHAFRTIMADCGANLGLIISAAGFQAGARAAAELTNVRLLTWEEFQGLYSPRWFERHMLPTLAQAVDPLIEYTEPFNSRITRKSRALPDEEHERFFAVREKWGTLAFLLPLWTRRSDSITPALPALPLRNTLALRSGASLPDAVLDATTLRVLLEALLAAYQEATADFDRIFGGRA